MVTQAYSHILRASPRNNVIQLILVVCVGIMCLPAGSCAEPLRIEGKEQLFQRVLVRNTSPAMDSPNGSKLTDTTPLQAFYVFERENGWLKVASAANATQFTWIKEETTVPWLQNIVAIFESSQQTDRMLFLKTQDDVLDLIESEAPGFDAQSLRQVAVDAELAGGATNNQVVALGPTDVIDQRSNLYVMPILSSSKELFEGSGIKTNVLEVAVVSKQSAPEVSQGSEPSAAPDTFQAGVVFVVDTTVSMQPFIEATQAAISEIYDEIEDSQLANSISFGVVGFRDSLAASPNLDYLTKRFVSFEQGATREGFLSGVRSMRQANSSSKGFSEDSFAGINYARSGFDWTPYSARYIVLVTDAGPRLENDILSYTGLSPGGLNNLVTTQSGASVFILHIKSPNGASNHAEAEEAYRALSQRPNEPSYYFDVPQGDHSVYQRKARELARAIIEQVAHVQGFELDSATTTPPEEGSIAAAVASSNQMMALSYLGRQNNSSAPDVFRAWVSDRDYERQSKKPLSIRLLLNKAQLSDLSQAIERIIEKAEENVISPDQFFRQVLAASADMSRRPEDVVVNSETTLGSTAQIADYLVGLPYTSQIMKITEDDWIRMSISEQQTIVNALYEKLIRYREYNSAADIWVDYLGNGEGSERAFPMLLDDLP